MRCYSRSVSVLHSEVVPALAGRMAVAHPSAARADDPALAGLMERVASGEPHARRELAERIAPRVRRVAQALMGRSLDADDAALHGLIELLRSYRNYRGEEPLERWVDRLAALSVLRFARAVRKRTPTGGSSEKASGRGSDERDARTFEQYLRVLSETSREVLLLRHALDFRVVDLPAALRCSTRAAKERLLAARRELRGLVRRRTAGQDMGPDTQRWCALRDREAVDEPLNEQEQAEIAALETREPEIWAYVAQVRALELYFAAHAEPAQDEDRALVEAALPSVQITAKAVLGRSLDSDADFDRTLDGEERGWGQLVAFGGCIALALGCVIALLAREPGRTSALPARDDSASVAQHAEVVPSFQPTVEPLASARAAQRGGRLRRAGRLLGSGAALGQGELLETVERPACLAIGDHAELCLAGGSALRIVSLLQAHQRVELVRGRLVASASQAHPARLELQAGGWLVRTTEGGVVALESVAEPTSVRVRALRGQSQLVREEQLHVLAPSYAALLQAGASAPTITALPQLAAQRDWELLLNSGKPASAALPVSTPVRAPVGAAAPLAATAALPKQPGSPSAPATEAGGQAKPVAAPPRPSPTAAAAALAELGEPAAALPVSDRAKHAAAAVDEFLLDPAASEEPLELPPAQGGSRAPAAGALPTSP